MGTGGLFCVLCLTVAFVKLRVVAGNERNAPILFGRLKDGELLFFIF
jgi:hypothetical protein